MHRTNSLKNGYKLKVKNIKTVEQGFSLNVAGYNCYMLSCSNKILTIKKILNSKTFLVYENFYTWDLRCFCKFGLLSIG